MNSNILIIGEILWDCIGESKTAAGAPLNFARHLLKCGLKPDLISAVGNDPEGNALIKSIAESGISAQIQHSSAQTGFARVFTNDRGQDSFELATPAAWDEISFGAFNSESNFDAVYFGTLAQRTQTSRHAIRQLVTRAEQINALRICDINLRPPFIDEEIILWSLSHCDILKFSSDERNQLVQTTHSTHENLHITLRNQFGIKTIIETLGSDGAKTWNDQHQEIFVAAPKVSVISTVGAGDAFLAAFCATYYKTNNLQELLINSVQYASNVISN